MHKTFVELKYSVHVLPFKIVYSPNNFLRFSNRKCFRQNYVIFLLILLKNLSCLFLDILDRVVLVHLHERLATNIHPHPLQLEIWQFVLEKFKVHILIVVDGVESLPLERTDVDVDAFILLDALWWGLFLYLLCHLLL